jgi:hypothetical protein
MGDAVLLPSIVREPRNESRASLFVGIFVMSLSSLLLELSLTRVFSVTLFYHFAFLAISIALLGLGAGGVYAFLRRDSLARWSTRAIAATASLMSCGFILVALFVVLRMPVSLHLTGGNFGRLTAIYLLSAIPFFFTGLVFSITFARESRHVSALYGADLVGAAGACLLVVPLLNTLGGPNAILASALGMAVAACVWSPTRRRRAFALAFVTGLVILIAANDRDKVVDVVYAKGIRRVGSWLLYSKWNAISRIEVDQWGDSKWVTIDADAATAIMNVPPYSWRGTKLEDALMSAPPAVCNVLRPRGTYAIIGPGGGVDVLRAIGNGSPSVTGIEINPLIATTIMRGLYADYSQHLYEIPQVHIEVSDGRSWIRNAHRQFDVVQMTLVDTWASTSAGAFALSENNLYTVQAFKEYFEHLKPDGMLAITRWEFAKPREAMRVVSVAMEALHELGVRDTRQHFMVVSGGKLTRDGVMVTVLAKKSPFAPEEVATADAHINKYPQSLSALYLPGDPVENPFGQLIGSNDPYGFARTYAFNVAPVTDDAPFFFFTLKLGQVLNRSVSGGMDWKVNLGILVLFMLLAISVLAVAAFLVIPLWVGTHKARPRLAPIWYFIAVGLGYMMIEIAFIQRFVLFLGHPTYALTVVVFLMLLASGTGSIFSRRWLFDPMRVRWPLTIVVAVLIVADLVLPSLLSGLVGLPFVAKLAVSGAVLVPIGFFMGMPFPTGLRALHGGREQTIEWAWAMNAAASVLGSVVAMVVAIQFGLTVLLAWGAVAYMAALGLTRVFAISKGHVEIIEAEAA